MKKYNLNHILSPLGKTFMALALTVGLNACDNIIYDFEEECEEPEQQAPEEPDIEPGFVRIYVRTNPGSGGTSCVTQTADELNSAETQEGIYVSIDVKENETYTLTATESNPEYTFVRWHDDTNDGDLTEGLTEISDIKATGSTKYTAIFEKIAGPDIEPEKGYYVKFLFEKNLQFIDGFSKYVQTVDLYVFNTSGDFVKKYQADAADLVDNTLELTDLPAGEYELIAWCGLGDYFTVPATASRREQLSCTMTTWSDAAHSAYQNTNLNDPHSLFHGRRAADTEKGLVVFNEKTTRAEAEEVYLTKNTNNFNITLQHRAGIEFDKSRFTVTMNDQNDVMRYNNEVSPEATTVEYRPYRVAIGTTETRSAATRADNGSTVGNFLLVELECARLMAGTDPRINVVDNETGQTIFSIPVISWTLKLRSSKYINMDDQEFLDRADNYQLMLFLDTNEDGGWYGAEINILDWHIVDDTWEY